MQFLCQKFKTLFCKGFEPSHYLNKFNIEAKVTRFGTQRRDKISFYSDYALPLGILEIFPGILISIHNLC
jgi:hypothetical protein